MKYSFILGYIDPGSGSIIFQMIIASLLGALVYIKKVRMFVVYYFNKMRGKTKE